MTSWYKPNLKLNSSLSSSQMQDLVRCNPGILLLSTRGFLKGCFEPREGVFLMLPLQPEGREGLLLLALGGKTYLNVIKCYRNGYKYSPGCFLKMSTDSLPKGWEEQMLCKSFSSWAWSSSWRHSHGSFYPRNCGCWDRLNCPDQEVVMLVWRWWGCLQA